MRAGVTGDPVRLRHQWGGIAWALPATAGAALVLAWLTAGRLDTGTTTAVMEIVLNGLALGVALALYVRWRITRAPAVAWVTTAVTALSLEHVVIAVTALVVPDRVAQRPAWALLVDAAFTGVIGAMVLYQRSRLPRFDPALLGAALALLVAAVRTPTLLAHPLLETSTSLIAVTATVTVLLHAILALALLHIGLPAPLPHALAGATLLLLTCGLVVVPVRSWHDGGVAGTWADTGGGLLLAGTAIVLLHATIAESARTVASLRHRVDEIEAGVAADRERLHEINATVAGIATASRLMHSDDELPEQHQERLDELLTAEIARLERLVEGRPQPLADVPLDETIERLVLAHRSMGRDVRWYPCGLVVRAHGDDVAEVLTTLLNNAAEHAPGSPVEISARQLDEAVEVTVSDHGPGVDDVMAEQIFDRGVRGRRSGGQGIGLYVARRLTERLGGSLFVIPAQAGSHHGAVFVLTLPTRRSLHGAVPTCSS